MGYDDKLKFKDTKTLIKYLKKEFNDESIGFQKSVITENITKNNIREILKTPKVADKWNDAVWTTLLSQMESDKEAMAICMGVWVDTRGGSTEGISRFISQFNSTYSKSVLTVCMHFFSADSEFNFKSIDTLLKWSCEQYMDTVDHDDDDKLEFLGNIWRTADTFAPNKILKTVFGKILNSPDILHNYFIKQVLKFSELLNRFAEFGIESKPLYDATKNIGFAPEAVRKIFLRK